MLVSGNNMRYNPNVGVSEAPRSAKLFIGGLSYDTTDSSLADYFSRFGHVYSAVVQRDPVSGHSRGFGFVTFVDEDSVRRVFAVGRNHMVDGRRVEAKTAVPRSQTPRKQPNTNRSTMQGYSYGMNMNNQVAMNLNMQVGVGMGMNDQYPMHPGVPNHLLRYSPVPSQLYATQPMNEYGYDPMQQMSQTSFNQQQDYRLNENFAYAQANVQKAHLPGRVSSSSQTLEEERHSFNFDLDNRRKDEVKQSYSGNMTRNMSSSGRLLDDGRKLSVAFNNLGINESKTKIIVTGIPSGSTKTSISLALEKLGLTREVTEVDSTGRSSIFCYSSFDAEKILKVCNNSLVIDGVEVNLSLETKSSWGNERRRATVALPQLQESHSFLFEDEKPEELSQQPPLQMMRAQSLSQSMLPKYSLPTEAIRAEKTRSSSQVVPSRPGFELRRGYSDADLDIHSQTRRRGSLLGTTETQSYEYQQKDNEVEKFK